MLYLEDYLEMIEHLPLELRDRFTEMREMDLSVQNVMDSLEKRSKVFFSQCRRNEIQGSAADNEFETLQKDYYKMLEDADEKVSLATTMHELVERYLKRLDSELFKFKCELEADNNGITEVLEKRSLELDGNRTMQVSLNQKENRYFGTMSGGNISQSQKEKLYRQKPEKRRDSTNVNNLVIEKRPNISSSIVGTQIMPTGFQSIRTVTANVNVQGTSLNASPALPVPNYNTQNISQSSNRNINVNVTATTANQPSISTSQQLNQNRRTTINNSMTNSGNELIMNREINYSTHNIGNIDRDQSFINNQRRHRKKLGTAIHSTVPNPSISTSIVQSVVHSASLNSIPDRSSPRLNDSGMVVEQTADGEWTYDPNEPRYCICNQVSYGDMVACDNEACPFEWFHYPCVGITQSPKGKWYCPKCTLSMRRRNRKN